MDRIEEHDRHDQRTQRARAEETTIDDERQDRFPSWGIAEAKQRFSEVVRAAEEEPQMVYNRKRRAAAVVGGETLDAFLAWREKHAGRSLAGAFAELRRLAAAEGEKVVLEVPPRRDRPNPFADDEDEEAPR